MKKEFITNDKQVMEILKLQKEVNVELDKTYKWILKNKDAFDMMNLKVHEAFWQASSYKEGHYLLDDDTREMLFRDYCDITYEDFLTNLKEKGLEFEPNHVGRTSSFYLYNDDYYNIINYKIDIVELFLCELYGSVLLDGFIGKDDTKIDLTIDTIKYIKEHYNLNDLIDDLINTRDNLYTEITEHFNNTVEVYKVIEAYKENQVENMRYFIDAYIENTEYDNELIERDMIKAEKENKVIATRDNVKKIIVKTSDKPNDLIVTQLLLNGEEKYVTSIKMDQEGFTITL